MFKAYEISEDVYWVGALEWEERYIHGFSMPDGSTNNAYIIKDEKTVLIDTCIGSHSQELLSRISDIVDPSEIDYIISNHSEKDHAGALGDILDKIPNAKIVTSSPKGLSILETYYGAERDFIAVKDHDTLNIGKRTLTFIHTPMVHWPDNMVTYSDFDRILFSNDAFGQFYASSKRFDDEVDECTVFQAAKKYFANIILPFTRQTAKALGQLKNIDICLLAPSHGVIWRSYIDKILSSYRQWCSQEPTDSAVVVFSTMYGSTKRIAEAITEAFMYSGVEVRMYDLDVSDISDIMTDVMDAKYLAIGSPTHNNTTLPPMGQFLTYLKGLAPKGRIGISFGSYGWAQAAQNEISDVLQKCGYDLPLENITCRWNESEEDSEAIFNAVTDLVK